MNKRINRRMHGFQCSASFTHIKVILFKLHQDQGNYRKDLLKSSATRVTFNFLRAYDSKCHLCCRDYRTCHMLTQQYTEFSKRF